MRYSHEFYEATDTTSSCFVFASAGTGKTKILVDRFIKHLIFGCKPQDILCVTFTNAAVYEMETRITSILEKLALDEDDYVSVYLREVVCINNDPSESLIEKVKGLFFEWMDNLSALKIVTIHSFCQSLLRKFPLEAGVSPDFEVMDDTDSVEVINLAKESFFKKISQTHDDSVRDLANILSTYSFDEFIEKIFSSSSKLIRFFNFNNDIGEYKEKLKKIFHVKHFSEIDQKYLCKLKEYENLEDLFLTKNGSIRKRIKIPNFTESEINEIAEIIYENKNNENKEAVINKTCLFLNIAKQMYDEYQQIKADRNFLDFADIIHKTDFLLHDSDAKEFALSQIARSIKHIMIDEAQDMNSDQWRLVSYISDEIFSNNDYNNSGTIFVVGDLKQSIYSFQDASPKLFIEFYKKCKETLPQTGRKFKTVSLNISYRSLPKILNLVDRVFHGEFDGYKSHTPFRKGEGQNEGIAELIHINSFQYDDDNDEINESDEIVSFIKNLVNTGNIKPNEIMILAKNRSDIPDKLIERLSNSGIKVSGKDRIVLNESLLVMDILALAEFAMNNNDDYALCCILKSPYVFERVLNEEEMFNLCYDREPETVFDRLKKNTAYRQHNEILTGVIEASKTKLLFEFFYYITSNIIRCYTQQDTDILTSFLETILKFSDKKSDSISEFITWFKDNNIQISRSQQDNDDENGGVKICTIHGSKGLESKVVILLDFRRHADKNKVKFIWVESMNDMIFFIKPSGSNTFEEAQNIIDTCYSDDNTELLRLLYVAMTRARDQLYVMGPFVNNNHGIFDFIEGKTTVYE